MGELPIERYTLCGDPAAEARVAQDVSRIAAGLFGEVGSRMRALILVGSFAREEGSILFLDNEPHAEPGYQLLAVFHRRAERERRGLAKFSASFSRLLRTRVDAVAVAGADLAAAPHSLFWFHVGAGQAHTLQGDPTAILAVPARSADEIEKNAPVRLLSEATVALALASLERGDERATLLDRLHRLALACGDAALLLENRYQPSLRARAELLKAEAPFPGLAEVYEDATRYLGEPKLRDPASAPAEHAIVELRARLSEIQLGLEAQRIGSPLDPAAYAQYAWPAEAGPEHPWMRAAVRAVGQLAPHSAPERLLQAAVALAYDRRNDAARAAAAKALHRSYPRTGSSDAELATALRVLAQRVLHDPVGHPFAHWRTEPKTMSAWLLRRVVDT